MEQLSECADASEDHFALLPPMVQEHICGYVDLCGLMAMSLVNHNWNRAVTPRVWRARRLSIAAVDKGRDLTNVNWKKEALRVFGTFKKMVRSNKLYDTRLLNLAPLPGRRLVTEACFSQGFLVVSARTPESDEWDDCLAIWRAADWEVTAQLTPKPGCAISSLTLRGGDWLAVSCGKAIIVYRLDGCGRRVEGGWTKEEAHGCMVGVCLAPTFDVLASGGGFHVRLWCLRSGNLLKNLQMDGGGSWRDRLQLSATADCFYLAVAKTKKLTVFEWPRGGGNPEYGDLEAMKTKLVLADDWHRNCGFSLKNGRLSYLKSEPSNSGKNNSGDPHWWSGTCTLMWHYLNDCETQQAFDFRFKENWYMPELLAAGDSRALIQVSYRGSKRHQLHVVDLLTGDVSTCLAATSRKRNRTNVWLGETTFLDHVGELREGQVLFAFAHEDERELCVTAVAPIKGKKATELRDQPLTIFEVFQRFFGVDANLAPDSDSDSDYVYNLDEEEDDTDESDDEMEHSNDTDESDNMDMSDDTEGSGNQED